MFRACRQRSLHRVRHLNKPNILSHSIRQSDIRVSSSAHSAFSFASQNQAPKDNKKKTIPSGPDSIRSADSTPSSCPPFTDHQSRPPFTGASQSSKVEEQIPENNTTSQLQVQPFLHKNAIVVLIGDSVERGTDLSGPHAASRSPPPPPLPTPQPIRKYVLVA